jgi:antirestriction protein ArdC
MRTSKNDRDVARQEGRAGVYGKVTDRIIGYIERNRSLPWRKPWVTPYGDMAPRNFQSGKPYRGVNAILTSMNGYSSPFWLTFNQAKALGGCVRKGERSTPIVYWNTVRKPEAGVDGERPDEDETDEPERKAYYGFYRMYSVFNAEQIDGIQFPEPEAPETGDVPRIQRAEELAEGMRDRPVVAYGGDLAYYSPSDDRVVVPERSRFVSSEEYYSTLFHELAHSTGHPKRLHRFGAPGAERFGSRGYSKEELVAEISSCFILNSIGISTEDTDGNSAAYIRGWLEALKGDRRMLVVAAGLAGKASDYIMGADDDERV